jgi:AhpD family alkylhydroperoxidase
MSTAARIDRPEFARLTPGVSEALLALGKAINESGLPKDLLELIKLRASQINACTFCLQFHLNMARGLDIPAAKLDLLAAWREAPVYSPRERIALAWTEALSKPADGVGDTLYAEALAEFGPAQLGYLTAAVANINAWNRIAVALRFTPPLPSTTA